MEEQGTWASRTQKHSEAGFGRPVDRGAWAAKTVKRPRQQPAHPQYANYWAPLTRKRHIMPHSAQPQHTNDWAPRTRKRHQQEHRPQRPTERSDPMQHAKGRTGDCPGPRKETTTGRSGTQGDGFSECLFVLDTALVSPLSVCTDGPGAPPGALSLHPLYLLLCLALALTCPCAARKPKAPKKPDPYRAWVKDSPTPPAAWAFHTNRTPPAQRRADWAAHCLALSAVPPPPTLANYSAADHAAAFRAALRETRDLRGTAVHTYAGYRGPWEENHFIKQFSARRPAVFEPLIPLFVPWMDILEGPKGREKGYNKIWQALKRIIRKEWVYLAVVQSDFGLGKLTTKFSNIIVLSSGGYGHVPIPLLKGVVQKRTGPRGVLVGSVVSLWQMRRQLYRSLGGTALRGHLVQYHGKNWRQVLRNSTFCMAPRGNGRTSFHVAEGLQAGCIPIYVWDDLPWLPYWGALPWPDFSISVPFSDAAPRIVRRIQAVQEANQTQAMLDTVLRYRESHFTFEGLMRHIDRLLADPSDADLRCQPLPVDSGAHWGRH